MLDFHTLSSACRSEVALKKPCRIPRQAIRGRLRSGAGSERAADQRGPAGVP